jgi:hypothetical protein
MSKSVIYTEGNVIKIINPIITISHSDEVVEKLEELAKSFDTIKIDIENSFSFPSKIITALEKLKEEQSIDIEISVKDQIIYELFDELNMTNMFTIYPPEGS